MYKILTTILRKIYLIPLGSGWMAILLSISGSIVLLPFIYLVILLSYIVKFLDKIWHTISFFLYIGDRETLLEPLNDLDYLMWRTSMHSQPLITCFFVIDKTPFKQIQNVLSSRIRYKDAFGSFLENLNHIKSNSRFFCIVKRIFGRFWFVYVDKKYKIEDHILNISPKVARLILDNPSMINDNEKENKSLIDVVNFLNNRSTYYNRNGNVDIGPLSSDEMRRFYGLLSNSGGKQLTTKKPLWRILVLDNVLWKNRSSSVLVGQFHHVIGDGSTLSQFVIKTILDNDEKCLNMSHNAHVTKSAQFWHKWISGLLWAAIAGPVILLRASLLTRKERSWEYPTEFRPQRSSNICLAGPICIELTDINKVKHFLNNSMNKDNTQKDMRSKNSIDNPKSRTAENKKNEILKQTRLGFSKRITFNDIILSCIASGYIKYVKLHRQGSDSPASTLCSTPASAFVSSPISKFLSSEKKAQSQVRYNIDEIAAIKSYCKSTYSTQFDDLSPYSCVLYNNNEGNYCYSTEEKGSNALIAHDIHNDQLNEDLYQSIHSNLNVVVTTNNRITPPKKLDNAFSIIVLPIPTCPMASPSERLKCVFESLQQYRKTPLPIIFIRYVQYTLSYSPHVLLSLWHPHSKSCSLYYSSVPGPTEQCNFHKKQIRDMSFALPLTDHIGLAISVFSYKNTVSISASCDTNSISNPDLLLSCIKESFEELQSHIGT
ncbi:hypothetical protein ACR3K2_29510 [Cryptosporidium serpentis]